ncbi:MAG: formimidoylglutamate deiminase [Pseudomonadota bacterium]
MTEIWAEHALLATGWATRVRISAGADGRITSVETGTDPGHTRVGLLLPAPVNLHSHVFQRAMAGLTERRGPGTRDSFWTWRDWMYRFVGQLTPEDIEVIAAFVQMEMLEAGYGAVAEFHYLHHAEGGREYDNIAEMAERVAAAAAATGIGLTLLPVLYTQGGCDGRPLAGGQRRFGTRIEDYGTLVEASDRAIGRLPGDARMGIAPHSLRAVSRAELDAAVALAGDRPIHIHIAEQSAEVEEVTLALGARPVTWLLETLDVTPAWCLIHATHMTPAETRAVAVSGAVAGLCPITESNLGDGIFDGARYHDASGRFGIGTDSNVQVSLAGELRQYEYSQRLRDRSRAVLATSADSNGRVLFEGAARGGAQAAGRGSGTIAVGEFADLSAFDLSHPDLTGRSGDAWIDAIVFAGAERALSDVWSAGRHLVRDGRHIARDGITSAYRTTLARVLDTI